MSEATGKVDEAKADSPHDSEQLGYRPELLVWSGETGKTRTGATEDIIIRDQFSEGML